MPKPRPSVLVKSPSIDEMLAELVGGFDELVADLHDAASDLNKIAGTLEVATDRGEINSDLPQTVADWLYKIAEDIEHAAICLPLTRSEAVSTG